MYIYVCMCVCVCAVISLAINKLVGLYGILNSYIFFSPFLVTIQCDISELSSFG